MKISRKLLIILAKQLQAKRIAHNIYEFENEIYYLKHKDLILKYIVIAYSVGLYGNTGRLDLIEFKDGKTEYYYY